MRKVVGIVVGVALGAFGLALSVKPYVRGQLASQLHQRGLEGTPTEMELTSDGVVLRELSLKLRDAPNISVSLREVRLHLGFTEPRLRAVEVNEGSVHLHGTPEALEQEWSAFRKNQAATTPGRGGSVERTETLRGIEVRWSGALGGDEEQVFENVQFERGPDGAKLDIDFSHLAGFGHRAELAGVSVEWSRGEGTQTLTKVSASELSLNIVGAASAPKEEPKAAPSSAPQVSPASKSRKDPAKEPSPESDDESAWLLSYSPLRPVRARALLDVVREKLLPKLPPEARIANVTVVFHSGGEKLGIGPSEFVGKREENGSRLSLVPKTGASGTPLSLTLFVPKEVAPVELHLVGGPVSFYSLGARDGEFGLEQVKNASLQGDVEVALSPDARRVSVSGELALDGVVLRSEKLAPGPVAFPKMVLRGAGEAELDGSRISLREAEGRFGQARALADGELLRGEGHFALTAHAHSPLVACQALLDSAPEGLLGSAGRMHLDGTLSFKANLVFDSRKPSRTDVHLDVDGDCRARGVPEELSPERFRTAFTHEVLGPGDAPMSIELGPTTRDWVPSGEISPYLEIALLVAEDGRFFRHHGFDARAIESSIVDNIEAGRFVRGASTISMQLAKNLYLGREKQLSRKFQEALFTLLLEQAYDKKQLLELYANVIELGPFVYGIGPAADHYFKTTPKELSILQAFFIASVLPNPTRSYFDGEGHLTPGWQRHIKRLVDIAHGRKLLTDEEHAAALEEELVFGQKDSRPPAAEGAPAPPSTPPPAPAPPTPTPSEAP